jgi:hypothetical protein
VLAPGNCSKLNQSRAWTGFVPGGLLQKVSTGLLVTTYSLEANIPGFVAGGGTLFDHSEFNLQIPVITNGTIGPVTTTTMALEGNAGLCSINGPMAFRVSLLQRGESACINIPAPTLNTSDISSVCGYF